jgi:hypothetical protein
MRRRAPRARERTHWRTSSRPHRRGRTRPVLRELDDEDGVLWDSVHRSSFQVPMSFIHQGRTRLCPRSVPTRPLNASGNLQWVTLPHSLRISSGKPPEWQEGARTMDHRRTSSGTDERAAGPMRRASSTEARGYPARDQRASIAAISGEGDESPSRTSVSGESDQVTEAVPMDLQQGLAGRRSPTGRRRDAEDRGMRPPREEGPRRSGSAFAVLRPPRTPGKSDEHGGTA